MGILQIRDTRIEVEWSNAVIPRRGVRATSVFRFPVAAYGAIMPEQPVFQGTIDVRDFGADDTGVTDSTAAINAAFEAAKAGGSLLVGMGGRFRVSGTVQCKWHCDFSASEFVGDVGTEGPVVRIADDDVYLKRLRRLFIKLPRITKALANCGIPAGGGAPTWPYDDEAVRIEGLSRSYVWFDYITFFRQGIRIMSSTETVTGTDFNQFYISDVNGCQTGLWLDVRARDSHPTDEFGGGGEKGGWVNENTFHGGAFRHEHMSGSQGTGPWAGCSHIKLTGFRVSEDPPMFGMPGINTFHHIGIEGNGHEHAIYLHNAIENAFYDCRLERFTLPDPPYDYPQEKIYVGQDVFSTAWRKTRGNRFVGGRAWDRVTDPLNDYATFEWGPNMTPDDKQYVWHHQHIGRDDDAGGGWVVANA